MKKNRDLTMDVRITPTSEVSRDSPLDPAWAETAVEDPLTTLADIQRQLGIDQGPLADELGALLHEQVLRFPEDFAPFSEHRRPRVAARRGVVDAVINWFRGLEFVEEEEHLETREVPLFLFNSTVLTKYLPNGWELSLSNEIYTDPEGEVWEGRGIEPDLPVPVFSPANPFSGHVQAIRTLQELIGSAGG